MARKPRSCAEDRLQVWLALRVSTRNLCGNDLSRMLGMAIEQVDAHLNFLWISGQIRRAAQSGSGTVFWIGEPPSAPSEPCAMLSARERISGVEGPRDLAVDHQREGASRCGSASPKRTSGRAGIVPQRDPLIAAFFGDSTQRTKTQ